MKTKVMNKIAKMKQSEKKGMAAIGWILTIVFTLAVVGIVWAAVSPAVSDTATNARDNIGDTTSNVLDEAADFSDEAGEYNSPFN